MKQVCKTKSLRKIRKNLLLTKRRNQRKKAVARKYDKLHSKYNHTTEKYNGLKGMIRKYKRNEFKLCSQGKNKLNGPIENILKGCQKKEEDRERNSTCSAATEY